MEIHCRYRTPVLYFTFKHFVDTDNNIKNNLRPNYSEAKRFEFHFFCSPGMAFTLYKIRCKTTLFVTRKQDDSAASFYVNLCESQSLFHFCVHYFIHFKFCWYFSFLLNLAQKFYRHFRNTHKQSN